jgi:GNAT superfamily N-acetyltransferase
MSERQVSEVPAEAVVELRVRYREETGAQIVHDLIHRRPGWTRTYAFRVHGQAVGFADVAEAGPWAGRPTVLELFLMREEWAAAFGWFERLLQASGATHFEAQTNCGQLAVLAVGQSRDVLCERIVFRDGLTTRWHVPGAVLRPLTPPDQVLAAVEQRRGGGEWQVEYEGRPVGKGGILFHYARPYGDLYMDIDSAERRRGLGSWLVQELKRECYALGAVPCARCNPDNVASRQTLQRAGFVPCGQILVGTLNRGPGPSP